MSIIDLISLLDDLYNEHGDLDVEARSHGCCPNSHYIREIIVEDDLVVIEV